MCAAIGAGCASKNGHNHEGHDHEAHDSHAGHEGHDHAAHNHATHEHTNCSHDHGQAAKPAPVAETTHDEEITDEIIFPHAQAERAGVVVKTIEPGAFRAVIHCSGEIEPAQGDRITLSAPVAGIVAFGGVKLGDGSAVNKGSTLMTISSKGIAQGDIVARTEAAYHKAEADLQRAESLLKDKIISQRDYDEAKLLYIDAKASYDALGGASAGAVGVRSPISGYVTSLLVSPGEYADVGQQLAVISQNRRLVLHADLSQRYLSQLRGITAARFSLSGSDMVYSTEELGGRLLAVGTPVQSNGYLVPVTFEFNSKEGIVPGTVAEVWLLGKAREGVLSVPVEAVSEQQGYFYIYIRVDEEGYVKRQITRGQSDGSRIEVLSGLSAGENVVVRGAALVKMAASSGEIPHGHAH